MTITDLKSQNEKIEKKNKDKLIEMLMAVNIAKLNSTKIGENCFTINSSEIFNSKSHILSPEYYDLERQFNKLISGVKKRNFVDAVNFIQTSIESGYIREGSNKFLLNEKVIEQIKTIL